MSWTPQLETQFAASPVATAPDLLVAHSVTPSPASPGSGVPAAAICHSALVSSRLPESAQACCAWNHVRKVDGPTPLTEAARSEEHTSELQSLRHLVCRLLLEKKKKTQ